MGEVHILGVPWEPGAPAAGRGPYVLLMEPGARADAAAVDRLAALLDTHPDIGLAAIGPLRRAPFALARRRALEQAGLAGPEEATPLAEWPAVLGPLGWRCVDGATGRALRPATLPLAARVLGLIRRPRRVRAAR